MRRTIRRAKFPGLAAGFCALWLALAVTAQATAIGESALLVEAPRHATATARENSIVLRISRAMFLKMLESNPQAAQRLRELFSARADQLARDFEKVHAMLARDTRPQ